MFLEEILLKLRAGWKLLVASMVVWLLIGGAFLFLHPAQWEALGHVRIGQIANNPIESISSAMMRTGNPATLKLVLQNMQLGADKKDIKKLRSSLQLRKIDDDRVFLIKVHAEDSQSAQKTLQNIVNELVRQHESMMKPAIQNLADIVKKTANGRPEIETKVSGIKDKHMSERSISRKAESTNGVSDLQILLQPPFTEPTVLTTPIYVGDTPVFPRVSTTMLICVLLGLVTGFICVFGRRKNLNPSYTER